MLKAKKKPGSKLSASRKTRATAAKRKSARTKPSSADQWGAEYLRECEEATTTLRDKAYFLGLDRIGALLEAARAETQDMRRSLVKARLAAAGAAF